MLAKRILILYQFDEQSFLEACHAIGLLRNDDCTFFLLNYIEVKQHTDLLISIEDLIKKDVLRKLANIAEKLQSCHPDLSLHIEPMALSTSEKLPFTPDLVIQNPKKGTKPHLLLKKYNKLSL